MRRRRRDPPPARPSRTVSHERGPLHRARAVAAEAPPAAGRETGSPAPDRSPSLHRYAAQRSLQHQPSLSALVAVATPLMLLPIEIKPAQEIAAAARASGADLLVVGTHGRSGDARGSRQHGGGRAAAPCPVVVVRGGTPVA
jgi:nucleotide-binding universal stress UspA family protein